MDTEDVMRELIKRSKDAIVYVKLDDKYYSVDRIEHGFEGNTVTLILGDDNGQPRIMG